jgi:hypothetical protein
LDREIACKYQRRHSEAGEESPVLLSKSKKSKRRSFGLNKGKFAKIYKALSIKNCIS